MKLPKSSKLVIFYIIAALQASMLLNVSGDGSVTDDDRIALLSFKSLLSDPAGALSSWSKNQTNLHPCSWHGVACDPATNRVTTLDLDFLNLTGNLSPSLSNLTSLTRLHLAGNRLTGNIPEELSRLRNLHYLNLSYNSFDGEIPSALSQLSAIQNISLNANSLRGNIPASLANCSNLHILCLDQNQLTGEIPNNFSSLRHLSWLFLASNNFTGNIPSWLGSSSVFTRIDLSTNSLTGAIPASLGNLTSLILLDLSENSLTGSVSPAIGNCSSLIYLYLSDNRLVGHIPDTFRRFPSLKAIDLSFNGLVGNVPPTIYNFSSVNFLSLGMNQLTGRLPDDVGRALPRLKALILQGNRFHGSIPLSLISNATGLQVLDLSQNSFVGLVPPNLGELTQLYHLNLGWNSLVAGNGWSFLSSLANCSYLQFLILCSNEFYGELPSRVGNLSNQLEWLVMGGNQLRGSIPPEIANLQSLTKLELDDNMLTGRIPAAIGSLQSLQVLDLSTNRLSGNVPAELGSLVQLNELRLEDNNLQGSIPASLGEYMYLEMMNLSHNQLTGAIPAGVVSISALSKVLDLSHNSLDGIIPFRVGSLVNLALLDFSYNRLSGEVPKSIGDCVLLQSLHLDHNKLVGPIPSHLSNLRGIRELDLSHNSLSGGIPEFLTRITTLQYLNLSFNEFNGEVPIGGIFSSNSSAIAVDGNDGLCGGHPMLQLPVCNTKGLKRPISSLPIIIPIIVVVFLLSSIGAGVCLKRNDIKILISSSMPISDSEGNYRKVSYSELRRATNGFSSENIIGVGSFGCVYRGRLDGYKKDVAVKVLDLQHSGALQGFMAECETLRLVRHRNLVKILTTCSTIDGDGNEFRALVYDLMPNGSLEEWVHPGPSAARQLSLAQMLSIAIDVASALEYLHHHGETPIGHCDLKPSNVLLDGDINALVGDFGLARFIDGNNQLFTSDAVRGSIGYVPPEYGMGGSVSTQGDVYSYGILVLEMLTGKRPTDDIFKDGLLLHKYVELAFPERVMEIVDPRMLSHKQGKEEAVIKSNEVDADVIMEECLVSMIKVALLCCRETPSARMCMQNVVTEMLATRTAYLGLEESKCLSFIHQANAGYMPSLEVGS